MEKKVESISGQEFKNNKINKMNIGEEKENKIKTEREANHKRFLNTENLVLGAGKGNG